MKKKMRNKMILPVGIILILGICAACCLFVYKPFAGRTELYSIVLSVSDGEMSEQDKIDKYCAYLGQYNEEMFLNDAGMDSAEAIVNYNEELDNYSIVLSLESAGEVSEEQIEIYKTILEKQEFAEIALTVNGEVR